MKEIQTEMLNEEFIDKLIKTKIEYSDTIFQRRFTFVCISEFSDDVNFDKCIFKNEMLIHSCDFTKNLFFENCIFYSKIELSVLDIKENLVFNNCEFISNFKIIDSTIHGNTSFYKCKFKSGINLFSNDEDSFGNVAFEGGLNIFG